VLRDRRPRPLPDARAREFEVAEIPPLPPGEFEVVLLLETLLAFRDKEALLQEIAGALVSGGRFAFTLEEGVALSEPERAVMPDAHTVWLTPLDEMHALLAQAGLRIRWQEKWSESHRSTAVAPADAHTAEELDALVSAHRLGADWLATGPVRKFAVVAEREPGGTPLRRG
jgi:hypothetical protein